MNTLKMFLLLMPLTFMCARQTSPPEPDGPSKWPGPEAHNVALVNGDNGCDVWWIAEPSSSDPNWWSLRVCRMTMLARDGGGQTCVARLSPGAGGIGQWLFDFTAARHDQTTVLLHHYLGSVGVSARITEVGPEGQATDSETRLSIPGHNQRGGLLSSGVAFDVLHPDLWLLGGRLWLALTRDRGEVSVTHCEWGHWDEWAEDVVLGQGSYPSLCGDSQYGLFLSFTDAQPTSNAYLHTVGAVTATGPVLLTRSADGSEWSEPAAVTAEDRATSSALAFHTRFGLVLVYSARRDPASPLFAVRSADFGATWGPPRMLTEPTAVTMRPDALFHGDELCVAFIEERDQTRRVRTIVIDPNSIPASEAE